MLKNNLYPALVLTAATGLLAACGGGGGGSDDKTDDVNETRIQIYNASPDSPSLSFEFEDNDDNTTNFLFITYGDASALTTVQKNGNYEVTVTGLDSDGEYEDILETELTIKNNQRNLVFASGDYPDIALTQFDFNLDNLYEDTFRLVIADFKTSSTGYDIYAAEAGESFSDSTLWATTLPGEIFEVEEDIETDTFDIYLTEPGSSDVIFTAEDVAMESDTGYVLITRDSFGPSEAGIALDKMTSSTTVVSYEDAYGDAQYRILNALDQTVDSSLVSGDNTYTQEGIEAYGFSDYETVSYGDYQITISDEAGDPLYSRVLLSLPQNSTRAAAVYLDLAGEEKVLTFPESVRQQTYQSEINFVNLSDIDQVDVYFVGPNETIESTPYDFQSVDFEEVESGSLPSDTYVVNVVIETEDDTLETVYISASVDFSDDYNYTMLLYKDDSNTDFGYSVLFAPAEATSTDDDDDDDDDE
ncbi:DUF4397 domain-containing protein [Neiella marina]|uniref:DUF4397 domain-containing protein n=1 Tax=Neiella holothuriorum TaxID=2870530 RepID=A0ABS7EIL0_9GAMM|nr:DUF4397 domain-containing protein [Neiella holothuriorum]MBW8191723.1 DUF4397 domain-containing protein [Neiella holothuriorum]